MIFSEVILIVLIYSLGICTLLLCAQLCSRHLRRMHLCSKGPAVNPWLQEIQGVKPFLLLFNKTNKNWSYITLWDSLRDFRKLSFLCSVGYDVLFSARVLMGVALLHKKDGLEWKFLLVLGFLQGNATKHWSQELLVAGGHSVCCRMFGSNPGYNPTRHITLSPEFWQLKTSPDIACHVSWWAGMTDVDVTCESRLTSSAETPKGKSTWSSYFLAGPCQRSGHLSTMVELV